MKWKTFLVLPMLFALTGCPWDDKKTPVDPEKEAKQKAAHDSFIGNSPPASSKPYNVLDYTKQAPKP